MAASTPTALSTKLMRSRGYIVAGVQQYIHPPGRVVGFYRDLFGLIDLLGIARDTWAVQTTSASNVAARVAKIQASSALGRMQRAGWRIEVHGWEQSVDGRWELRVVDLTGEPCEWSTVQKAGPRSRNRPCIQQSLQLTVEV